MLANQDRNVGRVLAKLEELGIAHNTIIVYFSDNGPNSWRWNGGMKGRKGSTDEGGVRSVCYIRWPARLPAGHTVTHISGAIDLLPTLTSLAGIPRAGDKPLDGRDLSPLLLDQPVAWQERMIFSTWNQRVSVRTQAYRLDHEGKLFDMVADPGQTTPINDKEPKLAEQLAKAVEDWRREMVAELNADGDSAANGSRRRRGGVDSRPIPTGYPEFPVTALPARDGEPHGGVKRSSSAPNCSYFVNWTTRDDSMVWTLDVQTSGRYAVSIDYTCPVPDTGATVEVSFGDSRLTGQVQPGWDPPLYTNQDTLPRPPAESQMKEFRTLQLGQITLAAGEGPLTLRAVEIPGKSVMDVRRVTLELVP